MRVSSPSSSSSAPSVLSLALVTVAVAASSIAIIVLITGGFTLVAGPLRFSAHRFGDGLIAAGAALALLLLVERRSAAAALAAVQPFIERHALAVALVIAAAAAGTAVAHGTYSAAGADAAGYVSEAALLAGGSLSRVEPLATAMTWPNAAWSFSPLGYRPGATPGEIVPTYPAGLPLLMAAALSTGVPLAEYLVVPFLAAAVVLITFLIGRRAHSPLAGVIAAALLATSPIFRFQSVQPMSDVPAAAFWALALLCAPGAGAGGPLCAGLAAGAALLTRPNLAPLGVAIIVAATHAQQKPLRRLIVLAAGTAPGVIALLAIQEHLYGSPLASGYGAAGDLFAWAAVWPNAAGYAARVAQSEGAVLVLVACALAVALFGPSAPSHPRPSHPGTAHPRTLHFRTAHFRTLALFVVLVVACYLPYGVFAEWFYLRFLLPAFPAALALAGALVAASLTRLPATVRGVAVILVLVIASSVNVRTAVREQAFNLKTYEARYRTMGQYLATALPSQAVVITSQESGSVAHYAGRPVLRWDLLDADLDTAAATLAASGRLPFLLVEDWELPLLRARHPSAGSDGDAASAAWRARAALIGTTRVTLFDLRDQDVAGATWPIDVLRAE